MRHMPAVLVLMLPAISHAADWTIEQLMHGLAQTRSGHASFVEKKSIAMLDRPVESSGELFYSAPDHLEKRTLKPKPELMTVDGDTLLIESPSWQPSMGWLPARARCWPWQAT